ncbi:MAG: hypothetical protein HY855_02885 [Burkholderiales bacterium]|nr:hypothetical protein [Burkholderiales bacterium]
MIDRINVFAARLNFGRMIGIGFQVRHGEDKVLYAEALTFSGPADIGECVPFAPAVTLDQTSAQQLMDELWRCGLRPSEGTGSAGSLAATERHLEDMRSIAFGMLPAPVEMPKRGGQR